MHTGDKSERESDCQADGHLRDAEWGEGEGVAQQKVKGS